MEAPVNTILLVGGGHAHLAVLADWIRNGIPCAHAILVTPRPHLRYSGTVPGWIAGQYARDFGTVDIAALAQRAGVELILDRCTAIDPDARTIATQGGSAIRFDLASIDTGGVGRANAVLGDDPRILDIRPIDGFVDQFDAYPAARRIAIVGGGAGGVELAFALRNRAASRSDQIVLVAGGAGLLPDLSAAVRRKTATELAAQGIAVVAADARIEGGNLRAGDANLEPVDLIICALGSGAPAWPGESGLACDKQGYIAVDCHQRTLSHPGIFAVGDVASRQDRDIPHSGVHAVFAGPVLAANLRSAASGKPVRGIYTPRWNNLYLISTGNGAAIASYGPLAAQGRWVARLKHWIDNRWLSQYGILAQHAKVAKDV